MAEKESTDEEKTEILEPVEAENDEVRDNPPAPEQPNLESNAKHAPKSANAGKAGAAIASLVVVALAAGGIGYAISSASGAQASADQRRQRDTPNVFSLYTGYSYRFYF